MELRSRQIKKEPQRAAGPSRRRPQSSSRHLSLNPESELAQSKSKSKSKAKAKPEMQLHPRHGHRPDSVLPDPTKNTKRSAWLAYAVGSGMCAAFNGVFAKLTTTQLTGHLSIAIANALGMSHYEHIVQLFCRAIFFILNLTFNGIMWTLFTKALAKSSSATQVAVLNSSTNFLVTAFAGILVFSESLPPTWWAGAALLVAGSVIAGRKAMQAEKSEAEAGPRALAAPAPAPAHDAARTQSQADFEEGMAMGSYRDEDDDVPHLGGHLGGP